MVRGRGLDSLLGGELRTSLKAGEEATLVVRVKAGGLVKPSLRSFQRSKPFDRFEKSTGATFSELSSSDDTSEAFRLPGEDESASPC
jgi:hypothetical protein